MSWTANGQTFAALGITGAVLSRASWGEHTCDLTADGRNADVALLFAEGAAVEIKEGSTVRFVGEVQAPGRAAGEGAEGHTYRLVNAWIILAETIYEQSWAINGGTTNKARCIVGLKANGEVGTLAEAITDVLTFAGVPAGSITLAQTEEPWEVRNVTCAEVLRQIQRLAPRSVSWWTYPGGRATFNVATAPDPVALAMTAKTSVDLRPNRAQAVRGVRLQYEIVRTVDDVPVTDVVVDSAGATTGRRILMQTIPWRGSDANFLRQTIKTRTIPTTATGTAAQLKATRKFWAEHAPALRASAAPVAGDDHTLDLTFLPFDPLAVVHPEGMPPGTEGFGGVVVGVGAIARYYFAVKLARVDGTDGTGAYELTDPEDEASVKIRLDTGLTRELVEGTVTPWMQRRNKNAQRWQLFANISYFDSASREFRQSVVSINFTATDCVTKEYTSFLDYADGDPVPSGLAAELFAALGATYHEGTVTRVEEECSGFAREGNALTITGGATEWTTMNALVQGVREDIPAGTTTLTVGVGTHLGQGDMLDLLRRARKRREADEGRGVMNAASRGDGLP